MVRKSLSSKVLEEIDRTRGLLKPVQDITDPMTSHLIGAALESLHRVESMCLSEMQARQNEVISDTPLGVAFGADALAKAQNAPAPRTKRGAPARLRGERR